MKTAHPFRIVFLFLFTMAAYTATVQAQGPAQTGAESHSSPDGIKFTEGSWQSVLAKAKSENKLIFVDAYAVWCGPCRKMSAETFPMKAVGDFFNKNFINYKMDCERGDGPAFAQKYGVRAYPTLFFINGSGQVVHQTLGYQTGDMLIGAGNMAVSKK